MVDTSRNGWGGPGRPTGPGSRTTAEEYVETSRTDRRGWDGNWCNQTGAGLGARPVAAPAAGNAPPSGQWFPAHFRQLLANAWPPLP